MKYRPPTPDRSAAPPVRGSGFIGSNAMQWQGVKRENDQEKGGDSMTRIEWVLAALILGCLVLVRIGQDWFTKIMTGGA